MQGAINKIKARGVRAGAMKSARATLLLCLLWLNAGEVGAWSLFGPNTYEDCLLEGTKTAKSKDLVPTIIAACQMKFPSKESSEDVRQRTQRDSELKRCGIGERHWDSQWYLPINDPRTSTYTNNIKSWTINLDEYGFGVMSFQNNNSFAVAGVQIGLVRKGAKSCPLDIDAYQAVYVCEGRVDDGVSPKSYGTLAHCVAPRPSVIGRNSGTCIISVSPVYKRFDSTGEGLLNAKKQFGAC